MTLSAWRLTAWTGCGAALALVVSLVVHLVSPSSTTDVLALTAWGGCALSSGLLLACAWRLCGRALAAHLAAAMIVLGTATPAILWGLRVALPPGQRNQLSAVAVALVALVAGVHLVRAGRAEEVQTDLLLGRKLLPAAVVLSAGTLVLFLIGTASARLPQGTTVVVPPVVLTGMSIVLAVTARRQHQALRAALAVAPGLLALGSLAVAVPGSVGAAVRLVSVGAAGALVTGIGAEVLGWAFRAQGIRSLGALAAIARYEDEASRDRRRRHDARSALAAIRAASATLATNGYDLDDATRGELTAAVREELSRVERLLDPDAPPRPGVVDLPRALEPALVAWRARGMRIDADLQGPLVIADPDVVLRIVGNLLDNVHRHAAATSVRLSARRSGRQVHLTVSDNGVGIPLGDRLAVFESGVSLGPRSSGAGLGLPSARALAESQGGALDLVDSASGTSMVLSLPAAPIQRSPGAAHDTPRVASGSHGA